MTDVFMNAISAWLGQNSVLAALACLGWGLASVLLSPCHVAAVSIMGTRQFAESPSRHRVALFVFGHCLSVLLVGGVLIVFGRELDPFDHYWTVPFGALFGYLAYTLVRPHTCSPPHKTSCRGLPEALAHYATRSTAGLAGMGLIYGLLSSGCVLGFLAPVLLLALPKGAGFAFMLTVGFAVGHCLPMLLAGRLAIRLQEALHRAEHHPSPAARLLRRVLAALFALAGLALVLHPFVE